MITKDFGFLISFEFYLLCFLMKTAVAISLKKTKKTQILIMIKGFGLSYFMKIFVVMFSYEDSRRNFP